MLGCGHAYTITTLDGLLDLESAYTKVRPCPHLRLRLCG